MAFRPNPVPESVTNRVDTMVVFINDDRENLSREAIFLPGIIFKLLIGVLAPLMDNDLLELPHERYAVLNTSRPFLAGLDIEAFFFK